jgi:hypothetical protein
MTRTRMWMPEEPTILTALDISPVVRVSGHFIVDLIDVHSGKIKQHLEFENCLTNNLLDLIGAGNVFIDQFSSLEVGTGAVAGSNAPTITNTSLVAPLSPRSFNAEGIADVVGFVSASSEGPYVWTRRTRTFSETQCNGNLSELGYWTSLTGGTLVNRTAFKDAGGTPIQVTKTSNDILRTVFEVRIYPPLTPLTGSLLLSGSSYAFTILPVNITQPSNGGWGQLFIGFGQWQFDIRANENQTLLDPTASIGGTGTPTNSNNVTSYVGGDFHKDVQGVWNSGTANFTTGIQGLYVGTNGTPQWQVVFSPKIPKTSGKTLSLNFRWLLQQKNVP